ncbi:unnamed protein product [Arabis nemorensis]|uniref:Jacalin-type lectin domain-containing protein n=1 Tax=Arabis nemorensis TaxID=586526 RepID=A0A565AV84_9BRAS|nr:unnamed protein product [Arabis nemorensis]
MRKGRSCLGRWCSISCKELFVGKDDACVTFVKFEYGNRDSTVESRKHGTKSQKPQEFELLSLEYITSVEGTYANPISATVITSLVFKTSLGRTSPTFGNQRFVLANNGQKLVGFHGRVSPGRLDALGAYFSPEPVAEPSPVKDWVPPKKLEAQGGQGGDKWDDGIYNGVRKVYVGRDEACVTSIMFDYVKDYVDENRAHGILNEELQEFLLDHMECIISVEGTYGNVRRFTSPVVTSLVFKTSKGRTSPTFGATKFVLEDNGRHIAGFHGRSGTALDSIGAHFVPPRPMNVECCIS